MRHGSSHRRSRWAALGASAAVALGAGGVMSVLAAPGNPTPPSSFVAVTPTRIVDTRSGLGAPAFPVVPSIPVVVDVDDGAPVPPFATAVVFNLTVISPTAQGNLRAYPADAAPPGVSNLNFVPGQTVPNLVTVRLPADGRVAIAISAGQADVVVDVQGYYLPGNEQFISVPSAALLAEGGASASLADGGLNLAANLRSRLGVPFVVPPGYDPSSALTVKLFTYSRSGDSSCVMALGAPALQRSREGEAFVTSIVPNPVSQPSGTVTLNDFTVKAVVLTVAAGALRPGDGALVVFTRAGDQVGDTCEGTTVTGAQIVY